MPRLTQEVDVLVDHAHLHQRPADDGKLRVVDPPERDGRQCRRHDERQQHDRTECRLERQVLVQQQRQPQAQSKFDDAGHRCVEERVEERESGDGIAPQVLVVIKPDPDAGAADLGVGEAEPCAKAKRIREKQQQQHRRRQQEHEPEQVPVVERTGESGRLCCHQRIWITKVSRADGTSKSNNKGACKNRRASSARFMAPVSWRLCPRARVKRRRKLYPDAASTRAVITSSRTPTP